MVKEKKQLLREDELHFSFSFLTEEMIFHEEEFGNEFL